MLLITGTMRSGTSMLARIAQQIGVDMGRTMMIPPCGLDAEYEDAELVMRLSEWVFEGRAPRDAERQIWQYLKMRKERYERDTRVRSDLKGWGVKSPLIALFLKEFRRAVEHIGEDCHIAVARRDMDDSEQSLQSCLRKHLKPIPWARTMRRLRTVQGEIQREVEAADGLEIEFDFIRQFPQGTATKLSSLMELGEVPDLEAATCGIRTSVGVAA